MRTYYFDAGNTRLKLWRCESGSLSAEYSAAHHGRPEELLSGLPEAFAEPPDALRGVSVLAPEQLQGLASASLARWGLAPQLAKSEASRGRVRSGYAEPQRLGVDRWLALLGADDGARAGPVCVADCGTALTIDVMLEDGCHQGGYILPGIGMMAESLRSRTGGVRFDRLQCRETGLGRDTAAAVGHGCLLAAVALIDRLAVDYGAQVVLTGGDAGYLRPHLRSRVVHEPHLLLKGLQRYFDDAGIR